MNHPDAEDLTRTLRGPRTLLELCLDLRMAHNGSADPISEEETAAALAYLNYRLATWKPSALPSGARFDECVRALVLATIIEVQCHQTERARVLGLPEIQSPITDAAIDAAVVEAHPLAGLPEAERVRIVAGAANAMPDNRERFVTNSVAAYHARQSGVGVAIGREGQWFPQSTGTHTFGGRLRADCAPEMLTREEAEEQLRAGGMAEPAIVHVLHYAPHAAGLADLSSSPTVRAILTAHVRWLDAQKSAEIDAAAEHEPK